MKSSRVYIDYHKHINTIINKFVCVHAFFFLKKKIEHRKIINTSSQIKNLLFENIKQENTQNIRLFIKNHYVEYIVVLKRCITIQQHYPKNQTIYLRRDYKKKTTRLHSL
jgi:hypothetical protein